MHLHYLMLSVRYILFDVNQKLKFLKSKLKEFERLTLLPGFRKVFWVPGCDFLYTSFVFSITLTSILIESFQSQQQMSKIIIFDMKDLENVRVLKLRGEYLKTWSILKCKLCLLNCK